MSQSKLLTKVVRVLDQQGIDYMLTGSLVSSLQGEPRATHDIDLVVVLDENRADRLLRAFRAPDYYLDPAAVRDALARKGTFNLIDVNGGQKVDFWLLTEDAFDCSRFARRSIEEVMGVRLMVSRPEDTILVKLRWAKLSGGSEKQFIDALRVYEVQRAKLDLGYLDHWAKGIGVEDLLQQIRDKAEAL